jgi:biofilm protein TabA
MILDNLSSLELYSGLGIRLSEISAYLDSIDQKAFVPGKKEITGNDLYSTAVIADGKGKDHASLEIHRQYIDLHYVIDGIDTIGWKPLCKCIHARSTYDSEKDILFYDDKPEEWINILPGNFAVFFPSDAHAPLGGAGRVHKIIFKILFQKPQA